MSGMLIVEIHTDFEDQEADVLRALTRTVGVHAVTRMDVSPPERFTCDSNPTRLG